MGMEFWTDERVEELKRKWAAGTSCTIIGAEMGNISRSMVIGKVKRLGLPARRGLNANAVVKEPPANAVVKEPPTHVPPAPPPARRAKPSRWTTGHSMPTVAHRDPSNDPVEKPDLPTEDEPNDGKGISLVELTNNTCRWPKGDPTQPGFLFCGDPSADLDAKPSRPYCQFHRLKAIDRVRMQRSHARDLPRASVNL